jgi:hypothetical protein
LTKKLERFITAADRQATGEGRSKPEGGVTMRKLAILLALGVVGSPSLAMAADVVTEVCQVNSSAKQLLTFIEASAGVTLPFSCKGASANCTQCDADLLTEGFTLSKAIQANINSPYLVFTREGRESRER